MFGLSGHIRLSIPHMRWTPRRDIHLPNQPQAKVAVDEVSIDCSELVRPAGDEISSTRKPRDTPKRSHEVAASTLGCRLISDGIDS